MPPDAHAQFYCRQRFTLNLTRSDMRKAGYSPSVRLFEAAACATPIISDEWEGLDELLVPEQEILLARTAEDVTACIEGLSDAQARQIGEAARERVCAEHSSAHRAAELESYLQAAVTSRKRRLPAEGPVGAGDRAVAIH